ncbi:MAG: NFACT RNA binding domain-containing protein [Bacteroidota bacterium]
MNNYYSLIYLNQELNDKLKDATFDFAITPHKYVLELYMSRGEDQFRLIFSTHPEETALFSTNYRPPKKSNMGSFFDQVEGVKIVGTRLANQDRLLSILFDDNGKLVFKLFSSRPNVWYAVDGTIQDAFRQPDDWKGKPLPKPQAPKFETEVPTKASPKNQLLRLNPLLPRNLIPHIVKKHRVDEMNPEQVKRLVGRLTQELEHADQFRVLTTLDLCLWPESTVSISNKSVYDTISPAIEEVYKTSSDERRLQQDRQRWLDKLSREQHRLERLLQELEHADKSLDRADTYERYGHLLMTKAHQEIKPDQQKISVVDFYQEDQSEVAIDIKPELSISDNAEQYYKKAQAARKNYEASRRRLPKVKQELENIEEMIRTLQAAGRHYEFRDWYKDHKAELEPLRQTQGKDQSRKPFREMEIGSYMLWVGRNAKSNDQLTSAAHKEDIWLHARGVSGSHVVIRMDNHKEYPPKSVIEAAARIAAWYSKARGSSYAPVMYTKRKYVRKSKNAGPGAVFVEREEVIMVEPAKPDQSWMQTIGG